MGSGLGVSSVEIGTADCDTTVDIYTQDENNDGVPDVAAAALGLEVGTADSDGDGILDVYEVGNYDAPTDSDADGIIDALEAGDFAQDATVADGSGIDGVKKLRLTANNGNTLSSVSILDTITVVPVQGDIAASLSATVNAPFQNGMTITLLANFIWPQYMDVFQYNFDGSYSLIAAEFVQRQDDNTVILALADGIVGRDADEIINGSAQVSVVVFASLGDDDNDGVAGAADACPGGLVGTGTAAANSDIDNDGCDDLLEDMDDDNDGVSDEQDLCPVGIIGLGNAPSSIDTDEDGCVDAEDSFPNDPEKFKAAIVESVKTSSSGSSGGSTPLSFFALLAAIAIRRRLYG